MNNKPLISVVIPTYNRPDLLVRCLIMLAYQSLDKSIYEIIVVDDANSKETKQKIQQFAREYEIHIEYLAMNSHAGPAAARNKGWRMAKADLIAFTDDDCIPGKRWLQSAIEEWRKGAQVISGKVRVPLPEYPTDYDRTLSHLETTEFVTANCICTKKALETVGGFDERFDIAWREDSDLQFSFLEHNIPITKSQNIIVLHPVKEAPWNISLKEQYKSKYNALLYKKHPQLYKSRIQATPPLHYYAILSLVVLGLCGIILKNEILSLIAFIGWLFFTGHFFLKRISHNSYSFTHVLEMLVTSFFIPFLSIYWRIYGAIKYKVLFI